MTVAAITIGSVILNAILFFLLAYNVTFRKMVERHNEVLADDHQNYIEELDIQHGAFVDNLRRENREADNKLRDEFQKAWDEREAEHASEKAQFAEAISTYSGALGNSERARRDQTTELERLRKERNHLRETRNQQRSELREMNDKIDGVVAIMEEQINKLRPTKGKPAEPADAYMVGDTLVITKEELDEKVRKEFGTKGKQPFSPHFGLFGMPTLYTRGS